MKNIENVKEVERRLNEGLDRTEEERKKCLSWLVSYLEANELTLNQLDNLCFENSDWVFGQIFN